MKASVFKELIKESVKEALIELLEESSNTKSQPSDLQKDMSFLREMHNPKQTPQFVSTGNPILDALNKTKASMTAEDYKGTSNTIGSPVSMTSPVVAESQGSSYNSFVSSAPQVGLDIRNLDFVKKAPLIVQKAKEIDKQRSPSIIV